MERGDTTRRIVVVNTVMDMVTLLLVTNAVSMYQVVLRAQQTQCRSRKTNKEVVRVVHSEQQLQQQMPLDGNPLLPLQPRTPVQVLVIQDQRVKTVVTLRRLGIGVRLCSSMNLRRISPGEG